MSQASNETKVHVMDAIRMDDPWLDGGVAEGLAPEGAPPSLPTGTVTFLLTDIEGSTRAWEADADTMSIAVARHYELIGNAIVAHNGARPLEQGEGDSTVGAFARPSDAVEAALAIQRAFKGELWPEGVVLRVRIAVHTGEAELRDGGNYFGPAIIRSARLRAIASGEQVLVSGVTADLVMDRLPDGASLLDLGPVRLKDLGRPEHVFQLRHPEIRADFPPLKSIASLPNNLPVALTSFVGREADLAELRELAGTSRLLTLTGAGGCGKTRLALQLADEVGQESPGGVWFIELAPLADAGSILTLTASVLGERDLGGDLLEAIVARIGDGSVLLVFDNCEHLLRPVAALADTLLHRCAALRVVATSREPLGVPGETTWRVPSLRIPDTHVELTDDAATAGAVVLFEERARSARPNFRITTENVGAVVNICRRLDGIPLAIELAAARVRGIAVEQLAAGLDDRFRLLTGGARTVLPRQQTLQASVDWSYDLLTGPERAVFRRLAVFAGGFTLDAAEHVVAFDDLAAVEVLELLLALVDKSMVAIDAAANRYVMLESLRQYGVARLLDTPDAARTRDRHLAWVLTLWDPIDRSFRLQAHFIPRLDVEIDNMRTAFEWAMERDPTHAGMRVGATLSAWELWRGDANRALETASRLRAVENPDPKLALLVASCLINAYYETGQLERGADLGEELLPEVAALNDDELSTIFLRTVAFSMLHRDAARGIELSTQACEAAERTGSQEAADGCRSLLVGTQLFAGVIDEAQVRGIKQRRTPSVPWRLNMATGLAQRSIDIGQFAEARHHLAELHGAPTEMPRIALHTLALRSLVDLMENVDTGALDDVASLLDAARRRGYINAVALSGWAPGLWELVRGEAEAGARALLDWHDDVTAVRPVTSIYGAYTVEALLVSQRLDDALTRADELLAREDFIPESPRWAVARSQRAVVLDALGRTADAEDELHWALAALHEHQWLPSLVDTIESLATIAASRESFDEAVRLAGAADSLRDTLGYRLRMPHARQRLDAALATSVEQLGPDRFKQARGEGVRLDKETAVAYANRARGERARPSVGWESLTPTEVRVATLIARGFSNREIAAELFVSPETVKAHLTRIFDKLSVRTRAAVAGIAATRT
jgi:predicted ATPase/class 3 adenylate cyclase/DNA-binding CsgD family transcriptional regulator